MMTGIPSCCVRSRIELATSVVAAPMISPFAPLASRSSRSETCLAGESLASVIRSSTFGYLPAPSSMASRRAVRQVFVSDALLKPKIHCPSANS